MKAIVHIGTEKTGTSSIQSYLYLNRKQLKKCWISFYSKCREMEQLDVASFLFFDDAAFKELFREEGIRTPEEKLLLNRNLSRNLKKKYNQYQHISTLS